MATSWPWGSFFPNEGRESDLKVVVDVVVVVVDDVDVLSIDSQLNKIIRSLPLKLSSRIFAIGASLGNFLNAPLMTEFLSWVIQRVVACEEKKLFWLDAEKLLQIWNLN